MFVVRGYCPGGVYARAAEGPNYGRKGSESERRVKVVFESPDSVDLKMQYAVYEEKIYGELIAMIGQISEVEGKSTLKRDVFKSFLDKI